MNIKSTRITEKNKYSIVKRKVSKNYIIDTII